MSTLVDFGTVRNGAVNVTAPTYKLPSFVGTPSFPFHLTRLPNGWQIALAVVGPDLARLMLDTNLDSQRDKRKPAIAEYTKLMSDGEWVLTHQGVAFNRSGRLFDGQHRLNAIIEAGIPVPLMVTFGAFDVKETLATDTGRVRTTPDAAKFIGESVHNRDCAVLRMMLMEPGKDPRRTPAETIKLIKMHDRAVTFGGTVAYDFPAPVGAAFARAWYYIDESVLVRMVDVIRLNTPATIPGDKSLVAFKKFMTSGIVSGARASRLEMRNKCLRSILAASEGQDMAKVCEVNYVIFPVPEDGIKVR